MTHRPSATFERRSSLPVQNNFQSSTHMQYEQPTSINRRPNLNIDLYNQSNTNNIGTNFGIPTNQVQINQTATNQAQAN